MPFATESEFGHQVGETFGKYCSTFRSATGQVQAQLFEVGSFLVAHVSFAPGFDGSTVTDAYVGELHRYAEEQGYGKNLRLIMSE